MKNKRFLLLLLCLIPLFSACSSSSAYDKKQRELYDNKINIKMDIKDYGTISLELYPNIAPITVDNFVSLVKSGFYNGLTFHRILDGYMIQGGDPTGTGNGGLANEIKGEFLANGVSNDLKHERGVISMARQGSNYNSASCQFFIVHKTTPSFDGNYAAFGKVTKGIEIVDEIVKNTKIEDSNGKVLKENQPIIEKIYVVNG